MSLEQAVVAESNKWVNEIRAAGNKDRKADRDRSYRTYKIGDGKTGGQQGLVYNSEGTLAAGRRLDHGELGNRLLGADEELEW